MEWLAEHQTDQEWAVFEQNLCETKYPMICASNSDQQARLDNFKTNI